jgi:hypothetical protein
VTVTTVVPGLMRTGSHLQARFTGQAGKAFDRLTALGRAAAARFNERPRPLPGAGSRPAIVRR